MDPDFDDDIVEDAEEDIRHIVQPDHVGHSDNFTKEGMQLVLENPDYPFYKPEFEQYTKLLYANVNEEQVDAFNSDLHLNMSFDKVINSYFKIFNIIRSLETGFYRSVIEYLELTNSENKVTIGSAELIRKGMSGMEGVPVFPQVLIDTFPINGYTLDNKNIVKQVTMDDYQLSKEIGCYVLKGYKVSDDDVKLIKEVLDRQEEFKIRISKIDTTSVVTDECVFLNDWLDKD